MKISRKAHSEILTTWDRIWCFMLYTKSCIHNIVITYTRSAIIFVWFINYKIRNSIARQSHEGQYLQHTAYLRFICQKVGEWSRSHYNNGDMQSVQALLIVLTGITAKNKLLPIFFQMLFCILAKHSSPTGIINYVEIALGLPMQCKFKFN